MTDEFVTITFDDTDHSKKFLTYESFFNWLDEEKLKWQWVYQTQTGNNLIGINQVFESIRQQVVNTQINSQPISQISNFVSPCYQASGWLRHSEGVFAKSLERIRQRHGDNAAAFVFAFSKQQVTLANVSEPSQLAACLLFALPELDRPDAIAKRLELERKNYRSGISIQLDKLDEASSVRDKNFKSHLASARRIAIRQLRRTRKIDKEFRISSDQNSDNAINSIFAVEETFRKKMELQAPVQYWKDKAIKHEQNADGAVERLLYYFPLAAIIFAISFWQASKLLLSADNIHQSIYVIVAAGLGSLAALIFWIGRLLTKLYLSQHHLMHSLSHENAASEDDKKIILSALFRPTVDGLIKEEGPSDLSLAGFLSRFGIPK
jgi:Family of unknown function (DUF6161)